MAKLVTLTVCYSIPEAHVLASALQSRRIHSCIVGLNHGTVAWTHLVALGGLEVRVLDAQLNSARNIVRGANAESEILTESASFRRHPWLYTAVFVFFMYLGAWYPLWLKYRRWKSD